MKTTFWMRLDAMAKNMTPVLLTLLLVLINTVPLHISGFSRITPLLPIMAIYFWTIYRSELMPVYAVFLIGVLQDSLSGMPIGISAFVYVVIHWAVTSQHGFFLGKSFPIVWLGFCLISGAAMVATWFLFSLFHTSFVNPNAALFQYILTIAIFPIIAWGLSRWQRYFLKVF